MINKKEMKIESPELDKFIEKKEKFTKEKENLIKEMPIPSIEVLKKNSSNKILLKN